MPLEIKIGDTVYGEKQIEAGGGKIIAWDDQMKPIYDETCKEGFRTIDFEGVVQKIEGTIIHLKNGKSDYTVRHHHILKIIPKDEETQPNVKKKKGGVA